MYPFQLDRITRPARLHWELFSGRCEFLLEEAHPSDVATGPITARDEDELGDVSLLHCISPVLAYSCREPLSRNVRSWRKADVTLAYGQTPASQRMGGGRW